MGLVVYETKLCRVTCDVRASAGCWGEAGEAYFLRDAKDVAIDEGFEEIEDLGWVCAPCQQYLKEHEDVCG